MAKCDFSIDFTGASEDLIKRAGDAINNAGGTFNGDPGSGSFSVATPIGKIEGAYQVSGQTISFSISEKPFLLGCGRIEGELRKYIS